MVSNEESRGSDLAETTLELDGTDPALTDRHIWASSRRWRELEEIIVTGIDLPAGYAVAMGVAAACSGRVIVSASPKDGWKFATIKPSPVVRHPKPLPHPRRPDNVPASMRSCLPTSVANDYLEHTHHARSGPIPTVPVSVVIPVYNRRVMLGRTLACLAHQTYPLELIEVVVTDDGSNDQPDEVLEGFRDVFGGIRYVRQEDEGFRVAEARNRGVRAAQHENVIFLDCDMAPMPRLVELHVRHLEAFPNALYCGHRRYVDANHVPIDEVRRSIRPMLALHDIETSNLQVGRDGASRVTDWRLPIYASTADLRFEPHPFRVVAGGNLSFTQTLFEISGGFDENFSDWGAEDVEWGYRVWNRGFYIVPLVDACALHQEPPGGRNETDREIGRSRSRPMLTDRCPVRFRPKENDGGFSVPLVSIYIPAYNAEDTIVGAVQSALDQTLKDLEVCVVNDGSTHGTLARLIESFGDNSRVRVIDQKNGGIGSASNRAVRMCRGAFIGQLDSDDELVPEAVEKILAPMLRDTRIGVAYGSHVKIDPRGNYLGDAWVAPRFSHYMLLHSMIVHHFRLFRARDWYRTAGFAEDIRNAVDYDMFLKMSEVTEMLHVEKRVYRYRIHDSSTSIKYQATQYKNHAVVVARALERRGLGETWGMEPTDPDDPRRYRFVERARMTAVPSLNSAIVRVIGSGKDLAAQVTSLFPTWENDESQEGRRTVVASPRLSQTRARDCARVLRSELIETDAVVELTK